jgi:hypothetical protein
MSGETTAPDQLFRGQQQRDIAGAKAAQKKADEEEKELDLIKKKILLERPEVHPLETMRVTDELAKTAQRIINAKRENPNDYLQTAYTAFNEYTNILNDAKFKSKMFKELDTKLSRPGSNVYVNADLKRARDLMSSSKTTEQWLDNLEKNGIQPNKYFNYDKTTGRVEFFTPPAYDPIKSTKQFIGQHSNDLLFSDYNPKTKEVKSQFGTVRTQDEADEIYKRKVLENKGSTVGVSRPYSGEQMAYDFFADPEALDQYIDRFKLQGATEKELVDHYLTNIYDPLAGNKDRYSVKGSLNITQNVSMGDGSSGRKFTPDTIGKIKIAGVEVTPFRRIALSDKPINIKANISGSFFNAATGQRTPSKDIKTQNLYMQEMYYLPVLLEGNKVSRIVSDSEIDTLKKQNKIVDFKPFVIVGEENFLTDMTKMNFDKNFLVPLDAIESNIKNTFQVTSKIDELAEWNKAKQRVVKDLGKPQ